ncbi:hypothetical protein DSLASN_12580 [Desulfoluna limicola]|uniref:Class III cytochrome C domain-containing protein n=1 Tax=Desulfoluna limicola TaxID=2810562 RepID=A0ABM7PEL8_9BACT|nr:cytochrome c3 family protein [Desulfoluna limicola]BCS95626.1 hypothetical protein DSLASN_12580 [Desulfoluna limicola]
MRKRVEATLASLLILLCVGLRLAYTGSVATREEGVGVITIDSLVPFGKMERPAVRFPHEKHASGGDEASCLVCHEARPGENAGIFFTFKGREGLSREEIKTLYHTECIACHADREAAKLPTGPQFCSGCHVNDTAGLPSSPHFLDFEDHLHALHADTAGLGCQACHDVFGEERPDESTHVPPGYTSHDLCITCHLAENMAGSAGTPLGCTGCHALPFMPSEAAELTKNDVRGGEVLFDHDLHETADISCETCHHKEPETGCAECHASGDATDGGAGVSLQVAMHTKSSERSCVGCHDAMGVDAVDDCTACHAPFQDDRP